MGDAPVVLERDPSAQDRIIVALDFARADEAFALLGRFPAPVRPRWVKVGLELFLAEGAPLLSRLRDGGFRTFLDLKLHDIPNTVASAVRVLGAYGPDLLTVHAVGGAEMLRAAAEAAGSLTRPPRLLAVTVLTSMERAQLAATGVSGGAAEQVERLAVLAWEAGVRGLVASPHEAAALRAKFGPELYLVTPGIREAAEAGSDDQKRTATAAEAVRAGATQVVVGRPLTRAGDPAEAFTRMVRSLEG